MTTVTVSHNEILVTTGKMLEALGLAQGQRELAAEWIAWQAQHGLAGACFQQLSLAVEQLQSRKQSQLTQVSASAERTTFDAHGGSALGVAALAVDYVLVQALEHGSASADVHNITNGMLAFPYLVMVAQRGQSGQLGWEANGSWVEAAIRPNAAAPTMYRMPLKETQTANQLKIQIGDVNADGEVVYSAEQLLTAREHALLNGITVDAQLWERFVKLSKGVLVEATDASRARGAGEDTSLPDTPAPTART